MSDAHVPLFVSIVIGNYNYGRFLAESIESALAQTYPYLEVIVVDDGSTDDSLDVVKQYGSCIQLIAKSNGGQASALNAGFAASRGDVVLFLDADDFLYPSAVDKAIVPFWQDGITKVQWPLAIIDSRGFTTGETRPPQIPPEGDFRKQVLERGPSNVSSSPTSGNAWSRAFLQQIWPIPEDIQYYRFCADEYLYTLAPVFGRVRTIAEPLGCYRIHGDNVYSSRTFRQKIELEVSGYEEQCAALSKVLASHGMTVNLASWRQHSWFCQLQRGVEGILATLPDDCEFVLVDGSTWGLAGEFEGRKVRAFFEVDGLDNGPPVDDDAAILRLSELLQEGVYFFVIAWPCFWWFEQYAEFFHELEVSAKCLLKNDVLAIFQLRENQATSQSL